MTHNPIEILRRVETWPQEDQEKLAEIAREIETRRNGVYVLSDDEKAALEEESRAALLPMKQSPRSGIGSAISFHD
jgi:hypothetical protein